jgi:uncharacterized membrane protein (UPF0127 family)
MNKKTISLAISAGLLLGLCTYACYRLLSPVLPHSSTSRFLTAQLQVKDLILTVDLADNDLSRYQGLSNRPAMDEMHGMYFIFDAPTRPSFIMRDMLFALDIIWIVNNRIIQIDKNLLPPTATAGVPIVVSPAQPITHVLEVNGGWSDRHNIQVGDTVVLKVE